MKEKILIVDDNENARTVLSDVLKESGYPRVRCAIDGVDAFNQLRTFTPDLIILDLNMPNMGGIEFYNKICEDGVTPKFPVFVITGRSEMEQLFKQFDVVGFIVKPFDVAKLLEEIDIVMEKRTVQRLGERSKNRVLVMNSDPQKLADIQQAFTAYGYDVVTASSGTEGIRKALENPVHMTLIDLALEDISGDMVAFRLNNMHKTHGLMNILYHLSAVEFRTGVHEKLEQKTGIEKMINATTAKELLELTNQVVRRKMER
ncbi:MAG: response regulator [Candidatus Omnitrophica bacterium]|nr:response regulator [Candidatus Omnitrophota bacterium]MCB9720003.1 response regulator [Candidatus Omnitrophota bacterium]